MPESIRKDKSLTSTEKLILSYLYTYQNKMVNGKETPSNNYFFDTQENLAEELGASYRTIKRSISNLIELGLIFKKKKSSVDGKAQYKNRLAIIMVDENNKLEINETPTKVKEEVIVEQVVVESEYNDMPTNKLKDMIKSALDKGWITIIQSNNLGHLVDSEYISSEEVLRYEINDYYEENEK